MGVGLATSLLFFGSVLFHELSHSFVAQRYGIPVSSITLFIFGGVSQISREARTPGSEFWIAISGPLSSIGLSIFFFLVFIASQNVLVPLAALSQYLSFINLALAGFNLIPGFPLDGGRVLRSIIWGAKGQFVSATRVASMVGQGVAYAIMLGGLFFVFTGDLFGGVWFIIIGWFLSNAAESSYRQVMLQDTLQGVLVTIVMSKDFDAVAPSMRLDELVTEHVLRHPLHAFPVVEDSALQGIVTLYDIKKAPQEKWPMTRVADGMTKAENLKKLSPRDNLAQAFQLLNENRIGQVPVVEWDQIVGLVTRADLMHYIHLRSQLGV
ncbi:MAG: site-2 protease family protein [Dehalococcoidia bacterium]|nr:site-2 protease family protein [Dehalococcoidia bacterium]